VIREAELDELMTGSGEPVARVELHHFQVELPATFRPAWIPGMPQRENRCTLIRVVTRDGVEGWSAGPALGRERAGLGDLVGPYLIGEDATDLHGIQQRLREMSYLGWRNWWIEPAFWDIKAKLAGLPLHRLLGSGGPSELACYASTGEVRTPEQRVADADARAEEGFTGVKLRVHADEQADAELVTRVAEHAGDRLRLAVDANQGWRVAAIADAPLWDLDRARRFARVCADAGLAWLEEPLAMDAYHDLATLRAESAVPIAGGELHSAGYPELAMMVERGCYDIFQPDAVLAGGVAQTAQLIHRVREAGLAYTPHTWTTGVGLAINLQLHAASGFADTQLLEYPYDPPGWTPEARDAMLTEPLRAERGRLRVPQQPGLGVDIDAKALRRHGDRYFTMDKKRLVWFGLRDRGLRAAREIDRHKRARRGR
jgi:L-alanine-DL-glutamate epimerase-like enolase superfamily enzyme